jgi:uncharacterized membrane protein SpoIIM required for sporulation
MRESVFVKKSEERWKSVEKGLLGKDNNPEQLRDQFIQVTDDLAYARTYYKNRSVRVYLNSLAQKVFNKLLKMRPRSGQRIKDFWTYKLPLVSYKSRRLIFISFILFLLSVTMGYISSLQDENFPRAFFGDAYVDMTLENIEKGEPMGVYGSSGMWDMFYGITKNNLQVAFLAFGLGVLFSIGSIGVIVVNGVMLGTFMFFFYSRGLASDFNYTVWLHGTFEMLSMVLECAAGMILGNSLLFPKTLPRGKSLQLGARRGITLMMGCVPFIIIAGFIESFVTRQTHLPPIIKLIIIFGSLGIIVYYFVIFPWLKFRNTDVTDLEREELLHSSEPKMRLNEPSSMSYNIMDAIGFFRKSGKKVLLFIFGLSSLLLIGELFMATSSSFSEMEYEQIWSSEHPILGIIQGYIGKVFAILSISGPLDSGAIVRIILNSLWVGLLFSWLANYLHKEQTGSNYSINRWLVNTIAPMMYVAVIYLLPFEGFVFFKLVLLILGLVWLANVCNNFKNKGKLFSGTFRFGGGRLLAIIGFCLLSFVVTFMVIFAPLLWTIYSFVEWLIPPGQDSATVISISKTVLHSVIASVCGIISIMMLLIMSYNFKEIITADNLKEDIEKIGRRKSVYEI